MVSGYDAQWNLIMTSSMFAEDAVLHIDGIGHDVRGVFISGSFSEETTAAYSPKVYVERDCFRFPAIQLEGKVSGSWKSVLPGSILELTERGLRFRVYTVIGKQGDIQLELQEIEAEAEDGSEV